ncbi:hypothetical protein EDB87DRAFT_1414283 [Lactarius vividus]|nr:hypothetical protein EDB87DRAFT_1414283 [Lactarius vividus]
MVAVLPRTDSTWQYCTVSAKIDFPINASQDLPHRQVESVTINDAPRSSDSTATPSRSNRATRRSLRTGTAIDSTRSVVEPRSLRTGIAIESALERRKCACVVRSPSSSPQAPAMDSVATIARRQRLRRVCARGHAPRKNGACGSPSFFPHVLARALTHTRRSTRILTVLGPGSNSSSIFFEYQLHRALNSERLTSVRPACSLSRKNSCLPARPGTMKGGQKLRSLGTFAKMEGSRSVLSHSPSPLQLSSPTIVGDIRFFAAFWM